MTDRLFRIPARDPAAPLRLFCFPHAGGGASFYRTWHTELRGVAEVVAIQLPGRENRIGEPPHRRLGPLVDELATAVQPLLDRPFALFGYSMGARVANAVARRLAELGGPEPERLFVAASSAASLPIVEHVHDRDDAALVRHLRLLGGTPEELFTDPELLRLLLPTLRADLAVIETAAPTRGAGLRCPVHGFAGALDPEASPERMRAWARESTGRFSLVTWPAGHFFIHDHGRELLGEIRKVTAP